MPAPYHANEITSALIDGARRAGLPLHHLTVRPDEEAQVWLIRARSPSGDVMRLTFPFASARGIYTPAEIAGHFTSGSWPFG